MSLLVLLHPRGLQEWRQHYVGANQRAASAHAQPINLSDDQHFCVRTNTICIILRLSVYVWWFILSHADSNTLVSLSYRLILKCLLAQNNVIFWYFSREDHTVLSCWQKFIAVKSVVRLLWTEAKECVGFRLLLRWRRKKTMNESTRRGVRAAVCVDTIYVSVFSLYAPLLLRVPKISFWGTSQAWCNSVKIGRFSKYWK